MPLALQVLWVIASQSAWLQCTAFTIDLALIVAPQESQVVWGPGLVSMSPARERRDFLEALRSSLPAFRRYKRRRLAGLLTPPCKNTFLLTVGGVPNAELRGNTLFGLSFWCGGVPLCSLMVQSSPMFEAGCF